MELLIPFAVIGWLFNDPLRCAKAYLVEMDGVQNAQEYQR